MKRRVSSSKAGQFLAQVARGWHRFMDIQLRGANLRKTRLNRADLRGADLRDTNMRDTLLRKANLQGADLRGADLQGADLRGADLQGARLDRVNMRGAWIDDDTFLYLEGSEEAHYTGVIISMRHRTLADLRQHQGLDTASNPHQCGEEHQQGEAHIQHMEGEQ